MGAFTKARGLAAVAAALLACGGGGGGDEEPTVAAPVITAQPADVAVDEGASGAFEVHWTGEVTSVRWQRDGVDLGEGLVGDGVTAVKTVAAGAATLELQGVPLSWSGAAVRAVLTGPGGSATSEPATLGVTAVSSVVFFTDFEEGALVAAIDPGAAPAALDGVQGFAGLGPAGDTFGGSFLRSPTANTVTLTLAGLPAHGSLDLDLLFAAIDSLDGTGSYPSGDFLRIDVDGVTVFRESFANATDGQEQSYVPPAGVELARKVDLGFQGPGGWYRDSAYDLGADPALDAIPHTASTATITFVIEGPGIQALTDESWAMDNLRVTANP